MDFSLRQLLACMLFTLSAHAVAGELNDTGMVRCVDSSGSLGVRCKGTGQDGQYGRDVNNPAGGNGAYGFHFTKICNNGEPAGSRQCPASPKLGAASTNWACTRDEVTGLTWEIKTSDGGPRDYRRLLLYQQIPSYLNQLNSASLCGSSQWRSAGLTELQGVLWYGEEESFANQPARAAIDGDWHPNLLAEHYYSSIEDNAGSGLVVNYFDGTYFDGLNTADNHFRGVSGKPRPSNLQADDSEVQDPANNLAWRRCAEGQAWNGLTCSGRAVQYTWKDGLQVAKAAARSSGLNWRLPNVKELASLLNERAPSPPKINKSLFPGMSKLPETVLSYLTSTPMATADQVDTTEAYVVDFNNGFVENIDGSAQASIRLVRDTK